MSISVDTKTILLVDDHSPVLTLYARALERAGFQVLKAGHAEEALGISKHYPRMIDVLVADVVLPIGPLPHPSLLAQTLRTGIDLAWEVCRERPETRVLFISGQDEETIQALGGLPRGAPFLRKPFSSQTLLDAIRDLLGMEA